MITTEEIYYTYQDTQLKGFMAYNQKSQNPSPCVLVAHDWGGRHQRMCEKAKELALMGYIGFAIDMYGDAKLGECKDTNRALMTPLINDRKMLSGRMVAAFQFASSLKKVDAMKIAAIGYCFGGLCVLDLARAGVDVKGVVSFHGLLSRPDVEKCNKIKAKVLVLHGNDDPLIPPQSINDFYQEMTEKKVDWQFYNYGLTKHSFTDKTANDIAMGLEYSPLADVRSWKSTEQFLEELFYPVDD